MAIAFVGRGTARRTSGGSGALSVAAASGTQVNDLQLYALVNHSGYNGSDGSAPDGAGWSRIVNRLTTHSGLRVWWRLVPTGATGSVVSATGTDYSAAEMRTYRGPITVSVINSASDLVAPGFTGDAGIALRVWASAQANTAGGSTKTLTPPSGIDNTAVNTYNWYDGLLMGDDAVLVGARPSRTAVADGGPETIYPQNVTILLPEPPSSGTVVLGQALETDTPSPVEPKRPYKVSYRDAVLADSPALFLPLSDAAGSTVVDISGNARVASVNGSLNFRQPTLLSSGERSMSAAGSGFVRIAADSWMEPAGVMTVEFRYKHDGDPGIRFFNGRWYSSGSNRWLTFIQDNKVKAYGNNGFILQSNATLAADTTYSIAVVYNGSTCKIFINGIEDASAAFGFIGGGSGPLDLWRASDATNTLGNVSHYAYYTTALSAARLAEHYAAAVTPTPYKQAVLGDGPVGYWRMADADLTAVDSSGANHPGTYEGSGGAVATSLLPVDSDGARRFDSANPSWLSIPNASWMNSASFSAEFLINFDSVTNSQQVAARTRITNGPGDTSTRGWSVEINGGKLAAVLTLANANYHVSPPFGPALVTGQTYHVVITWDGTTLRAYMDGEEVYSATGFGTGSVATPALPIRFGASADGVFFGNGYAVKAVMDEAAYYDYALPASRVAAHKSSMTVAEPVTVTTVALGQATEADTSQPITRVMVKTIGQPSETDSTTPVAPAFVRTVGQVVETETAQVVTPVWAGSTPVLQVVESDSALPISRHLGLRTSVETDSALPVTPIQVAEPTRVLLGQAEEYDSALPFAEQQVGTLQTPVETESAQPIIALQSAVVAVGQALEVETAPSIVGRQDALVLAIGQAVDVETAMKVGTTGRYFQLDMAVELDEVLTLSTGRTAIQIAGSPQRAVGLTNDGLVGGGPSLHLEILNPVIEQAPSALIVSASGGLPNTLMKFAPHAAYTVEVMSTDTGDSGLVTVSIDENDVDGEHVGAGIYTMEVAQRLASGRLIRAMADFRILNEPDKLPINRGPDTAPVLIPASLHPSGVRRWVLQDLTPGGLGSYVLPQNPAETTAPHFERNLSPRRSTAIDGTWHIYQPRVEPKEMTFKGYCPTEEMALQLRAYSELNRRFYLVDHRGRAWIVAPISCEVKPRLRQTGMDGVMSDHIGDYTFQVAVLDQEPTQL